MPIPWNLTIAARYWQRRSFYVLERRPTANIDDNMQCFQRVVGEHQERLVALSELRSTDTFTSMPNNTNPGLENKPTTATIAAVSDSLQSPTVQDIAPLSCQGLWITIT